MRKLFVLVCVLLGLLSCSKEDNPETIKFDPSEFFDQNLLIAHRGLDGYPENTYTAILAAIDAGYKAVECDIARTVDGVYVLSHDWTIDRCSNGKGRINELTYSELLNYDFGSWGGGKNTLEKK